MILHGFMLHIIYTTVFQVKRLINRTENITEWLVHIVSSWTRYCHLSLSWSRLTDRKGFILVHWRLPSLSPGVQNVIFIHVQLHIVWTKMYRYFIAIIKDEVLLTVDCPIFPPFYIDSQISVHRKFKKIDQLIFRNAKEIYFDENSQFFIYLLYVKSK